MVVRFLGQEAQILFNVQVIYENTQTQFYLSITRLSLSGCHR